MRFVVVFCLLDNEKKSTTIFLNYNEVFDSSQKQVLKSNIYFQNLTLMNLKLSLRNRTTFPPIDPDPSRAKHIGDSEPSLKNIIKHIRSLAPFHNKLCYSENIRIFRMFVVVSISISLKEA